MSDKVRHSIPFESFDVWGPEVAGIAEPERALTVEERIRDMLLEHGVPEAGTDALAAELSDLFHVAMPAHVGQIFAELLWRRLGHSVGGVAVIRLLLGPGDVPLRDDAARLGVSQTALWKAETKLRRTLELKNG